MSFWSTFTDIWLSIRNPSCELILIHDFFRDEPVTDDDLPVDMDILEKVCTGKKKLDSRPFEKTEFNPFGPVSKMKSVSV